MLDIDDIAVLNFCRGRFRPPNGPADTEKPLYLHISAGVQVRATVRSFVCLNSLVLRFHDLWLFCP